MFVNSSDTSRLRKSCALVHDALPQALKRGRIFNDLTARVNSVVALAMSQPEDVDVNEILYRPTRQEF